MNLTDEECASIEASVMIVLYPFGNIPPADKRDLYAERYAMIRAGFQEGIKHETQS